MIIKAHTIINKFSKNIDELYVLFSLIISSGLNFLINLIFTFGGSIQTLGEYYRVLSIVSIISLIGSLGMKETIYRVILKKDISNLKILFIRSFVQLIFLHSLLFFVANCIFDLKLSYLFIALSMSIGYCIQQYYRAVSNYLFYSIGNVVFPVVAIFMILFNIKNLSNNILSIIKISSLVFLGINLIYLIIKEKNNPSYTSGDTNISYFELFKLSFYFGINSFGLQGMPYINNLILFYFGGGGKILGLYAFLRQFMLPFSLILSSISTKLPETILSYGFDKKLYIKQGLLSVLFSLVFLLVSLGTLYFIQTNYFFAILIIFVLICQIIINSIYIIPSSINSLGSHNHIRNVSISGVIISLVVYPTLLFLLFDIPIFSPISITITKLIRLVIMIFFSNKVKLK